MELTGDPLPRSVKTHHAFSAWNRWSSHTVKQENNPRESTNTTGYRFIVRSELLGSAHTSNSTTITGGLISGEHYISPLADPENLCPQYKVSV